MASGDWVFTADPGKFIGDIQLFTSGTGPGKIDLVSVGVQSTTLDKSIAASVTLTDGDGDPTTTGPSRSTSRRAGAGRAGGSGRARPQRRRGTSSTQRRGCYDYGHGAVATAWASRRTASWSTTPTITAPSTMPPSSCSDRAASRPPGAGGFDTNHDGQLSSADANFANFAVWQDANSNGVADAGEVQTLTARGITSISLELRRRYSAAGGMCRSPVPELHSDRRFDSLDSPMRRSRRESRLGVPMLRCGAIAAAGLASTLRRRRRASGADRGYGDDRCGGAQPGFRAELVRLDQRMHTSDLLAGTTTPRCRPGTESPRPARTSRQAMHRIDSSQGSADQGPTELRPNPGAGA